MDRLGVALERLPDPELVFLAPLLADFAAARGLPAADREPLDAFDFPADLEPPDFDADFEAPFDPPLDRDAEDFERPDLALADLEVADFRLADFEPDLAFDFEPDFAPADLEPDLELAALEPPAGFDLPVAFFDAPPAFAVEAPADFAAED